MTTTPSMQASMPDGPQVTVRRHEVVLEGLRLGTLTVTPHGPHDPSPIIVTLGIMAHLDISEEQRFWLLADRLRRPVVAIDTPGWTRRGGALPASVRARLRRGGFDWLARMLGTVVVEANPGVLDARPSVLGYSLGASTGSALASDLTARGARLRGLTLVEPVAVRRQSLVELGWRNLRDARHNRRYAVENNDVAWACPAVSRPPVPRAIELGLLVWAISRGQIPQTVRSLPPSTPIMIISGELSTLAPISAMHRLVVQLRRQGRPVHQCVVPDAHHALWNSLPQVDQVVERIL